jgi:DNA polymerase III gamma/tau subunit
MINQTQINSSAMQRFNRLYANHRLAHAYLLVGPQDSGKTQTALSVALPQNRFGQSSRRARTGE